MAKSNITTIFRAKEVYRRLLILCADRDVWEFDGTSWHDRTGDAVEDGWGLRWTGGWITGGLLFGNRKVVRTFKPGLDDTSQPAIYNGGVGQPGDETWEFKNYAATVFRPFREYVLAGAPTWDQDAFPSRVQWCAKVEPGQVPEDWIPRADNDAGDVDLADTPGSVIDMAPLRDALMILKEDAIYLCQWIGGEGIFSFRRVTTEKGVHTTDCAVEFDGFLWCQGTEDIYTVDGNTAQSIVWGRVKKAWLADRDEARAQYAFTVLDPQNEEILFFYVSKNAPAEYVYPDRALALSLRTHTWAFREYGTEMPHAKVALDVGNQTSANLVFYAVDRGGARLLDLEETPDRLGTPVPAYFIRSGLFSDPGHDWVQIDEAKIQLSGNSASLQLGGQIAIDDSIDWRPALTFDPAQDYKADVRHNANLIAVRVDIATLSDWKFGSINQLVQKSGER